MEFSSKFQWAHLLFLLLILMMPLFPCAGAQSGTTSTPPLGFDLNLPENLRASLTIILAAFLFAFAFMGFYSFYLRHCTQANGAARNPITAAADLCRRGVSRKVIESCPTLVYSKVKDLKIGKATVDCAVCLGEFQDCDRIRLLTKCHHIFHLDCIDAWLVSHVTCPVCRGRLTSDCVEKAIVVPIESNVEMEEQRVLPNVNGSEEQTSTGSQIPADSINVGQTALALHTPDECGPSESRSFMSEKFPRSHSTGHSLMLEADEDLDGHTLRLTEHVSNQILVNHSRNQRSAGSDIVFPGEWSLRRTCYGNDGEGSSGGSKSDNSERKKLPMRPPFVSRGWGSVMPPKPSAEGDELKGKASLTSIRAALECVKQRGEGAENLSHWPPV